MVKIAACRSCLVPSATKGILTGLPSKLRQVTHIPPLCLVPTLTSHTQPSTS